MKFTLSHHPLAVGWSCAVAASASYGLNPLFTIPLYRRGFLPDEVLFYRYAIAAAVLGLFLLAGRRSWTLPRRTVLPVAAAGLLMAGSSLFLFLSYCRMAAGVASTMLFVYPVMVAVIMVSFFREKLSWITLLGLALALGGVAVLCRDGQGESLDTAGILFVLLSALTYALYIVGNKVTAMKDLPPAVLTFYGLLFGLPLFLVRVASHGSVRVPESMPEWGCVLGLALLPTVVSLAAIALAIRLIGATQAAVTGALEPATAVLVSTLFLGEHFSLRLLGGIILVVAAVVLVAEEKTLLARLDRRRGERGKRESGQRRKTIG